MGDILKNSGIVRGRSNQYGNTLQVRPVRMHLCPLQVAVGLQPLEHLLLAEQRKKGDRKPVIKALLSGLF